MIYQTSKAYYLLYQLLKRGEQIICFIDYDFYDRGPKGRDICRASFDSINGCNFDARGIGYMWMPAERFEDYEFFEKSCEKLNVEWVTA